MNLRFFNGTNHDNIIYNPNDCYTDRQNRHFLITPEVEPAYIIKRDKPLNAYVSSQALSNASGTLPLYFADSMSHISLTPIDGCPANFDVIIVSNLYASLALQCFGINPDYLDRLYVPVPLFDRCDTRRKIGAAGLKKVSRPYNPQDYLLQLHTGYPPSIASIQTCIDFFQSFQQPIDAMTSSALTELQQYISNLTTPPYFNN